jgi:hypothetical protein
MSNDEPQNTGRKFLETDIMLGFANGLPLYVRPVSDRCRALFIRWGMEEDMFGILPPTNAEDLISSVPRDWVCEMCVVEEGDFLLQEIPLPQPLVVLH